MSLFEHADDPGVTDALTQRRDRWHAQHRPDTAAMNGMTNKTQGAPVPRVSIKDARLMGSDGSRNLFFIGYQPNGFPNGSVGMKIARPGGNVLLDPLSSLIFYWDFATGTMYYNDPVTGRNYMQDGILPNGVGGSAVARGSFQVQDMF